MGGATPLPVTGPKAAPVPCPLAGSLERVIDLHQRGHLTSQGRPHLLEGSEAGEDGKADSAPDGFYAEQAPAEDVESGGASPLPPPLRLTAGVWEGGVRASKLMFSYRQA